MPIDLSEESYEELEKQKLNAEIKNLNRSPLNTPAFWAPLITLSIAAIVYAYLWKTGIFDFKQAHITYVTDTLTSRAKYLDTLIKVKEREKSFLDSSYADLNLKTKKIQNELRILDSVKSSIKNSLPIYKKEIAELTIENKILADKYNATLKTILSSSMSENEKNNEIKFLSEKNWKLNNNVISLKSYISTLGVDWNNLINQNKSDGAAFKVLQKFDNRVLELLDKSRSTFN